ncbi:hypothetical protein N0V90_012515 [Kalmusia sp. IMI 367209]|nr:hypothetical protein N0V90_012515 [Kalmusia sp. IMI 367209]
MEDEPVQVYSLADIPELRMRSKVAQLMAVAPGLPVTDLYDLLLEMRGSYMKARESVVRQFAQAPDFTKLTSVEAELVKQESLPPNEPLTHDMDAIVIGDDDENIMVKVDWDDHDLWEDNDNLSSIPPTIRRPDQAMQRTPRFQAKSKSKYRSNTSKRSTSAKRSSNMRYEKPKSIPKTRTLKQIRRSEGIRKARSKARSRRTRSNSIENIFVIPDSDSGPDDDDDSYQDSDPAADTDNEVEDRDENAVEMEHLPEELYIDMRVPF